MALLCHNHYIYNDIFDNNKAYGINEQKFEYIVDINKKNLKNNIENYNWLITGHYCKKLMIKRLRLFFSQRLTELYFSNKKWHTINNLPYSNTNYGNGFITFLMEIMKLYRVNYYFKYIKSLIVYLKLNPKGVNIIMEYYSTCGCVKKFKLFELLLNFPKKSAKYRQSLCAACCGKNTQLINYLYKKNLNKGGSLYSKIFRYAFINRRVNILKWLMQKKVNIIDLITQNRLLYLMIGIRHFTYDNNNKFINKSVDENKIFKFIIKQIIKYIDESNTLLDESNTSLDESNTSLDESNSSLDEFITPFDTFKYILKYLIKYICSLKYVQTLENLLLLEQRVTLNNGSIPRYIIELLFNHTNYSNKIYDTYFKMFVKFGIFKVDSNNKIINTTIKNYRIFINRMVKHCIVFNKKTIIQLIKFGATDLSYAFNYLENLRISHKSDKLDNFIKWLKEYISKMIK
jgi:hypothetical protein